MHTQYVHMSLYDTCRSGTRNGEMEVEWLIHSKVKIPLITICM